MSVPIELEQPPTDAISSLTFSPSGSKLAVSSWDRAIYIYERTSDGAQPFTFTQKIAYEAPVLDIAFGGDDDTLYSVGLDHGVQYTALTSHDTHVLSAHDKPSNKVAFSQQQNLVISISWDQTMHVHDPGKRTFARIRLPAKPFGLSLSQDKAVVAMAERRVCVYLLEELRKLVEQNPSAEALVESTPWQVRESSLKFMTRAVCCMPDGEGWATSSIEGRVGVEWFDANREKDAYAFKCHRQTRQATDENGFEGEYDIVYPVNALAFNPVHHTFATGGGDGVVAFWDAQTKRRVKLYKEMEASVAALDFSSDGKFLAIGICPGFEDGKENEDIDQSLVKVIVRELAENEGRGKAKT